MLTFILTAFLSSHPGQIRDPWAGRPLFSQTPDGSVRLYHHGPGSVKHHDHVLPKGHLFASDESEPFIRTELKGGL